MTRITDRGIATEEVQSFVVIENPLGSERLRITRTGAILDGSSNTIRALAGGTSTQTPGAVASVSIAHGLGAAPTIYSVIPGSVSAASAGIFYVTAGATNLVAIYASALTAATEYSYQWSAAV